MKVGACMSQLTEREGECVYFEEGEGCVGNTKPCKPQGMGSLSIGKVGFNPFQKRMLFSQ